MATKGGGDAGPDHVQHLMMVSSSYYILAAVVVGVAAVAYTWWRLVGRAAIHRRAHRIMSDMLSDAGVVTGRDVVVHDTGAFVEWMRNGSLGIGETYMRRDWDTREMSLDEVLFRLLMLPRETKRRLFKSWSTRWVALATRVLNMQSESRAKMVADAHYNLGNEFFKLWLDANMQYSCAYWKGVETLDEAQVNKMRLLARKLKLEERKDAGLGSSSSSSSSQPLEVLDLGCGWGTLACYLAENYNVRVTGVNISVEQIKFARALAEKRGLAQDGRVRFVLADYRKPIYKTDEGNSDISTTTKSTSGDESPLTFDRCVSVGFLEHVGYRNLREFFTVVSTSLRPSGIAVVQCITTGRTTPFIAEERWIPKYIFPNGYLPSPSLLCSSSEMLLTVEDMQMLGHDYYRTLKAWHENYSKQKVKEQVKQERGDIFDRMWDYYLLYSAAGFRGRKIHLAQVVYSKHRYGERYDAPR